ncbi:MAG: N-acetylmuramoyl-L-alanine amidase [Thermodesulfobacteriota bacterium]
MMHAKVLRASNPLPWLLFLALALLLCTPARSLAAPADIARQYSKAKEYYQELLTTDRGKKRENWLTCVTAFRSIYKAAPKHDLAPNCLFMLGRLYQEMHDRDGKAVDLGEAIAYYEDVANLFPKNSLADDALLNAGILHEEKRQDSERAIKAYTRLVSAHPKGDMAAAAGERLRRMKQGSHATAPEEHKPAPARETAPSRTEEAASPPPPKENREGGASLPTPPTSKGGKATVLPIRHWSNKRYTRVSMELSQPTTFTHRVLVQDEAHPRRIYIDLHNSRLAPGTKSTIPVGDGLLSQVRNAQFDPNTVRVVLDTQSNIEDYKVFTLSDPYRVVIDVTGNGQAREEEGKTNKQTAASAPSREEGAASPPAAARRPEPVRRKIIIDPGHGGKDPGAISPGGLMEKEIVLDVGLRLAKKLREQGCEVVLTRDRDVFIPLEERTAIANAKEGDLFVSVHVNAAPNREARGIETFVLDLATNKDAMRVAAMENASSAQQVSDLQAILLDLMYNSKVNESLKLAGLVQDEMVSGLGRRFSEVNNLGVKKAPFVVLIGAQMPAILTEIAFMSNPDEEKRLKNDKYLAGVADHIAAGVSQYIEGMKLAGL